MMAGGDSEVENHLSLWQSSNDWMVLFRDSGTPTEGSNLNGWLLNVRSISGLQWLLRH